MRNTLLIGHSTIRGLMVAGFMAVCMSLFSGCEQVVPSDELPYIDHIVIKGFLIAGEPLDSISITHTLPLSSTYDPSRAAIPNAHVTVTVDGRTIPLSYIGYGLFSDPAGDTIVSGKMYHLSVDWNGLHAESAALVPVAPVVDSFRLSDPRIDTSIYYPYYDPPDTFIYSSIQLNFGVRPHPGEVYELMSDSVVVLAGADTEAYDESYESYYSNSGLFRAQDVSEDGHLWVVERQNNRSDSLVRIVVTLASYDGPYYDFRKSFGSYDQSGIFGVTGSNPKWNVTGDGIGIFVGMATSRTSFTVRR